METRKKNSKKRQFADFQNKYRRSSNFGYGSKRDRFAIAGDGELSVPLQSVKQTETEKTDTEERDN